MDRRPILLGTARGLYDDRAVIRCHDGHSITFRIEGGRPQLGQDVVGRVERAADGTRVLDISPQATESLDLGADATISLFGEPEIASRLMFRLSKGAAAFGPGPAGTVSRSHRTGDADLDWAMDALRTESLRHGIALNVLDARALASSPWAADRLSELLPSDVCDDPESTGALLDCLRSGFSPTTRLILEPTTNQQSVEFIIPYNVVAGGWSFLQREARTPRRNWPKRAIPAAAARRLSALRQMALSFTPQVLPRTVVRDDDDLARQCSRMRLANSFADAAAAIAWRRAGGDLDVLRLWADAKEASGFELGELPAHECAPIVASMTANAIRSVLESEDQGRSLLQEAAAIAAHACRTPDVPGNKGDMIALAQKAHDARERLFIDCERIPAAERAELRRDWLRDLADVMTHLGTDSLALTRLATVGRASVPLGLQDVFDMEMDAVGVSPDQALLPDDGMKVDDFVPAAL